MSAPGVVEGSALDVESVREDFPALHQEVHGKPLVYFDNAATTQKPDRVIDAVARHDREDNANVHRGVHALSQRATDAYEQARERAAGFLGAEDPQEIVFTRGTTEAINLVAHTHVAEQLEDGDEILLTEMEHHSNIVPWQQVAERTGAQLRVAPIEDDGSLDLAAFEDLVGPRTAVAAFTHVSNALGTVNPVQEMTELAKDRGATVLVDGAQAAPHRPVDVDEIGCDFYAMSGHKVYGPTGIGALQGDLDTLEATSPYQGGGEMIRSVTFEETRFADPPQRFEAGTPNITGAVGLGEALAYLEELGLDRVRQHEDRLLEEATQALGELDDVEIVGTADEKASVLSFTIDGVHPHDAGTILDRHGVAIRAGHHCAQPVMDRYDIPATCRASFGVYNHAGEVPALVDGVTEAIKMFE
jgi:cysteine desulfurase/selenocysteine lyase